MSALTREQIKAMRAADGAVLRFSHDQTVQVDEIVLSKDVERPDGFGRESLRVRIPARAIVQNYGSGGLASGDEREYALAPAISGSWYLGSLSVRAEWATFARFVRAGDELVQEWVVDNRNLHIMRAGVTAHELKVRVERPAKNGRIEVFGFMLDAHAELAGTSYGYVTRDPNWVLT
jgi:hypothetical protein